MVFVLYEPLSYHPKSHQYFNNGNIVPVKWICDAIVRITERDRNECFKLARMAYENK